ncbi:hypothetical protein HELRODRAFT_191630 [Helobdella robusta]|uniref:VPS37 C-terminal domain-containing protein n=1 Tax=Helobdella robusta TaxID=6412 RepID=T1FT54_HELRO|nr:hypothetical protein HELRODRAFT_191630 [Helobdella robusta]ESO04576.1 hypothetical protein HELRODRAFT_191630 [Helobdella robusta]
MDYLNWLISGSTGATTPAVPELTALEISRQKHIKALKSSSLRLIEYEKDNKFQIFMIENADISLHLHLGKLFPQEKPTIQISEPLKHPWIDMESLTIANCPALNNFTIHSDLSRILKEIISELNSVYMLESKNSNYTVMQHQQNQQQQHQLPATTSSSSSVTSSSSPSIAHGDTDYESITRVQDLDKLSLEEIIDILSDDEKLSRLTTACHRKQIDTYKHRLESMEQQIEHFAESNMKLKKEMELKKSSFIETHKAWLEMKDHLSCAWDGYEQQLTSSQLFSSDGNSRQLGNGCQQLSLLPLLDNVKVVAMEAEEEADAVAEEFVNDKMTVDAFVNTFLEKRKLFHTRKIKEEKLAQLIYNGTFRWVLRSALNFVSNGEAVREGGREFQRKEPKKANADLA